MTTHRSSKDEIKEAVSESLLEALHAAQDAKAAEDSGINWVLNLLSKLMPMALLAMMAWLLLTVVETQKDLVEMRIKLVAMDNSISSFIERDKEKSASSALIHHSATVSPCNSCHTQNGIVVHTLAASSYKGAGALFDKKCSSCHSLDRVLGTQASRDKWKLIVKNMQMKRNNWISNKEAEVIIDYIDQLEKHK